MKNKLKLVAFIACAMIVQACSTPATRTGHHGLLDNEATSKKSDRSVDGKNPNELYALKPGGDINLKGDWQWPLTNVEVSSSYGERSGKFHQGIDLRAPMKTPVYAASDGVVVYVGTKIRGYGRMVVLKHAGNFYTVYAHHSKNLVKMGMRVTKGQKIALSGRSGHASGPHLHFELRQGTQSFDPEYALNGYFKGSVNRKIASQSKLNHDFEE